MGMLLFKMTSWGFWVMRHFNFKNPNYLKLRQNLDKKIRKNCMVKWKIRKSRFYTDNCICSWNDPKTEVFSSRCDGKVPQSKQEAGGKVWRKMKVLCSYLIFEHAISELRYVLAQVQHRLLDIKWPRVIRLSRSHPALLASKTFTVGEKTSFGCH